MNKPTCIIYAPVDTYSGYGARSRDLVKALINLKDKEWEIKVFPCAWGNTPTGFIDDNPEWQFLNPYVFNNMNLQVQPEIMIWITIPSEAQPVGKFNICFNAGIETTLAPNDWIEGLNRMNLNIVSSEHSKKIYLDTQYEKIHQQTKQSGGIIKVEKPIEVLFEGVDVNVYKTLEKPNEKIFNLNTIPEDFCFLFLSHWIGPVFEDRKNVGFLIKAFFEIFKNKKKKPALILKTSLGSSSYMDRDEILKRIQAIRKSVNSKDLPNIYLLHGEFTDTEINELYNHPKVKAMVNLTKGEGFGRTLLEFTQTKKPIITTNWSGHLDFLKPEFTTLINGKTTPVNQAAVNKWIVKESQWFTPDSDGVGYFMKDMFENYDNYIDGAKRQAYFCKTNFSFEKMQEKLGEYLKQVPEFPKQITLKLPNLPKKINLPKLQKI